MNINDFKDKKITVMGLGLHGGAIGTVRFLSSAGARIVVTDIKSKEELAPSIEKIEGLKNIELVLNQHRPEDFTKVDMVVKNPAASWNNKYIQMALEKHISVEVDSSLFFKLCHNPIIGITGTKGKTTTATLIYEILKKAGKNVIKVGVGQTSVLDKIEKLKKDALVVFELSSWRLSALGKSKMSPHVAVITNIYPDHLNYYKTMEEYVADKKFIYSSQKPSDFCILNWDDEILNKLELEIKSQLIKFSSRKISSGRSVYVSDGIIYLNDGIDEKKIIEVNKIRLKGAHNVANVLAAIAAAHVIGIDLETIRKTILGFEGIIEELKNET